MTTHVFIVNQDTFPAHLQYMFAGTSAGKKDSNIGLLADIKRVRTGDKVIFYFEGVGFYGIFKIRENLNEKGKTRIYYDKDNYCEGVLKRKLLYRVLIEPDEVYPHPVSEWEALEKLPDNPRDIIWSLIYRKLKGGRGCSVVTTKESDKLINLIKNNNKQKLESTYFTWENGTIIPYPKEHLYNLSNAQDIDIEAILYKNRATETYLQAYFTENAGHPRFDASNFSKICGKKDEIKWLANEFYCGVGMQKIDVFTITNEKQKRFNVIELKTKIDNRLNDKNQGIHRQLERYVKWCRDYLVETSADNLLPMIVVPKPKKDIEIDIKEEVVKNLLPNFNKDFSSECKSVKYFEFDFDENKKVNFQEIIYS